MSGADLHSLCRTGQCSLYGFCLGGITSTSNTATTIALRTTAAAPATTSINLGYSYAACVPGQQPYKGAECELGATAQDAQNGNLTSKVLVCAPAICTAAACMSGRCSRSSPCARQLVPSICLQHSTVLPFGHTAVRASCGRQGPVACQQRIIDCDRLVRTCDGIKQLAETTCLLAEHVCMPSADVQHMQAVLCYCRSAPISSPTTDTC